MRSAGHSPGPQINIAKEECDMPQPIRRKLAALLTLSIVASPSRSDAADPKVGTVCSKAKLNVIVGQVQCTKAGKRYQWRATPPPTSRPPSPVAAGAVQNDLVVKAALEAAVGGEITFIGTCGFQYGCNAKVHFPDADPATPSLLSIGGMPAEIFQNQLIGRQLVPLENVGLKAWSDDKRALFFMPSKPIDRDNTHYEVRLTVTAGVDRKSVV